MREPGVTTEFLDAFADAWNRHDADAILSQMTPDAVFQTNSGPEAWGSRAVGHDEIRQAILATFDAFPDARWNGPRHFIAGDRGVTQWVFTGTGPEGPVEQHGCDVFTFAGGRIAVKDSYRKRVVG